VAPPALPEKVLLCREKAWGPRSASFGGRDGLGCLHVRRAKASAEVEAAG
jgi:hypothetical protein